MGCDDLHPITSTDLADLVKVFEGHGAVLHLECSPRHRSVAVRLVLPEDEYGEKRCRDVLKAQRLQTHEA